MFFWDPTFILLVPAIILAVWAQHRVRGAFAAWSEIETSRRITGAQAAEAILASRVLPVKIERISGNLTDHYDPRKKVLRLSQNVYDSTSVAAVGIAAHECGHAIQHGKGYSPLAIRNAIVPIVSIGSNLAIPLFIIGIIFSLPVLIKVGIFMFGGAVIFHLITLPVEYDASHRALDVLNNMQILSPDELIGAREVLNAAAMTYVAAALMAIMNLMRLILISRRR